MGESYRREAGSGPTAREMTDAIVSANATARDALDRGDDLQRQLDAQVEVSANIATNRDSLERENRKLRERLEGDAPVTADAGDEGEGEDAREEMVKRRNSRFQSGRDRTAAEGSKTKSAAAVAKQNRAGEPAIAPAQKDPGEDDGETDAREAMIARRNNAWKKGSSK